MLSFTSYLISLRLQELDCILRGDTAKPSRYLKASTCYRLQSVWTASKYSVFVNTPLAIILVQTDSVRDQLYSCCRQESKCPDTSAVCNTEEGGGVSFGLESATPWQQRRKNTLEIAVPVIAHQWPQRPQCLCRGQADCCWSLARSSDTAIDCWYWWPLRR